MLTVNGLRSLPTTGFDLTSLTEDELTVDPLLVLKCDTRVFRYVRIRGGGF